jgi:DNA-binding NarL/FixJ family response regulator
MTEANVIRVLIVDDHAVVREGIRHVLSADPDFEVIGEASGGKTAVDMAERLRPDVIVLDISMPDLPGLDAAKRIREILPDAAILVLSIHDHPEYVLRSIEAGTQGYLRKDSSPWPGISRMRLDDGAPSRAHSQGVRV